MILGRMPGHEGMIDPYDISGYNKQSGGITPTPTPEIFEVEMTLNASTFTTSKTLQETIDAIEAGKQISFSLNYGAVEGEVICYGGSNMGRILMIVYDGIYLSVINWVGDENFQMITQIPIIFAGS